MREIIFFFVLKYLRFGSRDPFGVNLGGLVDAVVSDGGDGILQKDEIDEIQEFRNRQDGNDFGLDLGGKDSVGLRCWIIFSCRAIFDLFFS